MDPTLLVALGAVGLALASGSSSSAPGGEPGPLVKPDRAERDYGARLDATNQLNPAVARVFGARVHGTEDDPDRVPQSRRQQGERVSVLDRMFIARWGEGRTAPPLTIGPMFVSPEYSSTLKDPAERVQQLGATRGDFTWAARVLRNATMDVTWTSDEAYRLAAISKQFVVDAMNRDEEGVLTSGPNARAFRHATIEAQRVYIRLLIDQERRKAEHERTGREILMYMEAIVIGPSTQILSSAAGAAAGG